ncbi:MAG: hypothetical protein V3T84_13075 [Phycisphaerales bacterium]
MKSRFTAWMNVTLVAVVVALMTPSVGLAQADDDPRTEDIVYMADGRVLHGQILSETQAQVIFQYIDRKLNLQTKLTLARENIDRIDRDVPIEDPIEMEVKRPSRSKSATSQPGGGEWSGYGHFRADSDAENVPSFYVVPMKGQMGTDIMASIYKELIPDIREQDPDVIIIVMNSADYADTFAAALGDIDVQEISPPDFDEYKKLASVFHDDLKQYRQVVWVQDAVGIASTVALSWKELYMKPDARLGGMQMVIELTGANKWSDDDIRAKMMAAWMGSAKSLLEYGGYAYALADAMMYAPNMLSASFKGREVVWSLDEDGEFVIDNDDEHTANFRADAAENLLISDGTADTLDDLALLLGFREYRVVDAHAKKIVDGYREDWRAAYSNAVSSWKDYQQYMGWANGEDAMQYLSKAKRAVERIIRAMDRYPPIELRWKQEMGSTKFQLEMLVEQLTQRIRALRQQRGTRGRGGGGLGAGGG